MAEDVHTRIRAGLLDASVAGVPKQRAGKLVLMGTMIIGVKS